MNDRSSDETKYCNVLESLKKNNVVKDYAIGQIVERTENARMVRSILDVMDEKYLRTTGEKMLELMKKIVEFKTDENFEELVDKFGKMITEVEKLDLEVANQILK